jgi:hypothetical protein
MMNPTTTRAAALVSRRDFLRTGAAAVALGPAALAAADRDDTPPDLLIGYTEFRTDLPGGRYVNVWTMRAAVIKADGTGRRVLAEELTGERGSWTQFYGWSPDGKTAILLRGWESEENGKWEEEHRIFRYSKGGWLYDAKRDGVRQLYVMRLSDKKEWRITDLKRGHAAMWASWQPRATP